MMEIIAQAVRVIDYENNSVQRRNVNMMPKFKDYIEQLIVHVSNNVSIREYHTCLLYTSWKIDDWYFMELL